MSCGAGWTTLRTTPASWATIAPYIADCPDIVLVGTEVDDGAAIGTVVGTLSITNGFGSYTFTLSDPGAGAYFEIVGSTLRVLSPPSYGANPTVTIEVEADNGLSADPVVETFIITVNSVSTGPSYDFSDPDNSMYL